jgi:hypothetical protein
VVADALSQSDDPVLEVRALVGRSRESRIQSRACPLREKSGRYTTLTSRYIRIRARADSLLRVPWRAMPTQQAPQQRHLQANTPSLPHRP